MANEANEVRKSVRKTFLLSKRNWERVAAFQKREGLTFPDAARRLLDLGLDILEAKTPRRS